MKILILKPSSLGDVVQALPVLRLIKQHCPEAEVYWWLEVGLIPLLERDPDLAGLFPFDRRRWRFPWRWHELGRSLRAMRAQAFDWVIDLQGLARSGLVGWLANGRNLIGVADPREGASAIYDYAVPRPAEHCHAVDWYVRVLPRLGVPAAGRFVWMARHPEAAAAVKQQGAADAASWIALVPGARWPNKRWPVEYFVQLTEAVVRQLPSARLVVLGGPAEREAGGRIRAAAPERVLDLTGRTTLAEMVEWIRVARVVVSNDSGPMHVAAAMGRAVVALFGPTEPRRTGPYGQWHHVMRGELPCLPCLKPYCRWPEPMACLHQIKPEAVLEEVLARHEEALPEEGPRRFPLGTGSVEAGCG